MGNILVLGVGPLPYEQTDKLFAPGLRTWQIAELLGKKRHRVAVGLIEFGDFEPGKGRPEPVIREDLGENISVYRIKYHPEHTVAMLTTLHKATKFSCIVSTTDIMNFVASEIPAKIPAWLDYNGDPFAEKQLQAMVHWNDAALREQWDYYFRGLITGDRFSCVSSMQKCAMIGQLGFAGRLNERDCGEELVHVIPACSRAMEHGPRRRHLAIKGHMIPASSFLILWTGGYNTWCDPETLYHGVAKAMEKDPAIFYASTGGAIVGHDVETFRRFETLVESSPYKERFLFLGWRPTDEVASIYAQADVAINCDRKCVEGELGSRNRIIDWVQFKVPVLTTRLCEFTQQFADRELISTFQMESPDSLCDSLLAVKSSPDAARQRAVAAKEFFDTAYQEELIFKPLLDWAQNPRFAADREHLDPAHFSPSESKRGATPPSKPAPSRLAALHQDFMTRKWEQPKAKPKSGMRRLLGKLVPGRKS